MKSKLSDKWQLIPPITSVELLEAFDMARETRTIEFKLRAIRVLVDLVAIQKVAKECGVVPEAIYKTVKAARRAIFSLRESRGVPIVFKSQHGSN